MVGQPWNMQHGVGEAMRPWGHDGANIRMNKTASFQKEAMRTQVALYFFMKWNLYRVVSLCLNKRNVQNRQIEKSLLL